MNTRSTNAPLPPPKKRRTTVAHVDSSVELRDAAQSSDTGPSADIPVLTTTPAMTFTDSASQGSVRPWPTAVDEHALNRGEDSHGNQASVAVSGSITTKTVAPSTAGDPTPLSIPPMSLSQVRDPPGGLHAGPMQPTTPAAHALAIAAVSFTPMPLATQAPTAPLSSVPGTPAVPAQTAPTAAMFHAVTAPATPPAPAELVTPAGVGQLVDTQTVLAHPPPQVVQAEGAPLAPAPAVTEAPAQMAELPAPPPYNDAIALVHLPEAHALDVLPAVQAPAHVEPVLRVEGKDTLPVGVANRLRAIARHAVPHQNIYSMRNVPAAADWGCGQNERVLCHTGRPVNLWMVLDASSLSFFDRVGNPHDRVYIGGRLPVEGDSLAVQQLFGRARPRNNTTADVVYASRLQTIRERGAASARTIPFEEVYNATDILTAKHLMPRITAADIASGDYVLVEALFTRWRRPAENKKKAWVTWDVGFELQSISLLHAPEPAADGAVAAAAGPTFEL
ncbi:hypothetical protein C8Q79DRAFT_205821 [Trametes meyenii]|nr:hypothetical protein C8Q79DRAFT_205821 [Trametes meyenii]